MANEPTHHQTTDRVADYAHKAVDRTAETAARAEERLRERREQARERSQDLLQRVDTYVRDKPLTSLGLAFVAGAIISSWTRR